MLLSRSRPIAEELARTLREHPAADRVEVAGSVRRWAETCKDIDLIATAEEPAALAEHLVDHPLIAAAGNPGPNGVRAQTHNGISVDLRIVAPEAFGNLLQHFTGSAAHNVQLREEAVGRGLSVSEHGITDVESGEVDALRDRGGGLRAARLRLHRARAARGPRRAEGGRARASCRSWSRSTTSAATCTRHTTLSDGRNTLEEMAEAGRERGYAYMAITDHSASHGFGDHVTAERLWERIEEVARLEQGQARLPPARRLGGQHRPRRLARLPRRPARGARLGRRQRPHLLLRSPRRR